MIHDIRNPCSQLLLTGALLLAPSFLFAQDIANAPAATVFAEHYRSALIAYKNGDYKTARDETLQAGKLKADAGRGEAEEVKLKLLQGRIALELGEYPNAEKLISAAIDANPDNPIGYQYLGDVYLRQREFVPASDAYHKFLKLKPKDPDGALKLVYCNVGRNDLAEAGKILLQLDQFNDLHPGYYFGKASIAQAAGKKNDAESDLTIARTMYGNDIFATYMKGYLRLFPQSAKP